VEKEFDKQEIFSERVRAGKRTYFFDVKATRSNDYYLTITESKRRYKEDGFTYEKHKIFLYKEDFDKFVSALNNTVNHVKDELMPEIDFSQYDKRDESRSEAKTVEVSGTDSTDAGTEETIEETTDKTIEETTDKTIEETTDEIIEETTDEIIEETTDETTDETKAKVETEKTETEIDTELKWD